MLLLKFQLLTNHRTLICSLDQFVDQYMSASLKWGTMKAVRQYGEE